VTGHRSPMEVLNGRCRLDTKPCIFGDAGIAAAPLTLGEAASSPNAAQAVGADSRSSPLRHHERLAAGAVGNLNRSSPSRTPRALSSAGLLKLGILEWHLR
jgi:hypothetical protein